MSRLPSLCQQLFALDCTVPDARPALDDQGRCRVLVLGLSQPADWLALGRVWAGVQDDWGWPAPAIAVDGQRAMQLWFVLAEPAPAAEAAAVLAALVSRFLPAVEPRRLLAWPGAAAGPGPALPPQAQADGERWSAFVAPDLAPLFADTPWLDLPPGPEGQAQLLGTLRPVPAEAWHDAQARLQAVERAAQVPAAASPSPATPAPADLALTDLAPGATDPRAFLQAVMADVRVPLALRVQAATALLPRPPSD